MGRLARDFFEWEPPPQIRGRLSEEGLRERVAASLLPRAERRRLRGGQDTGGRVQRVRPLGRVVSVGGSVPGLSDMTYRAVKPQDVLLTTEVHPGSVKVSYRFPGFERLSGTSARARRGRVREFSKRSRRRLMQEARDFEQLGIRPHYMQTLTYPGSFEVVVRDGRQAQRHLKAFRKRLERYFEREGMSKWGGLWFEEFQRRGAPHFHILLWGVGIEAIDIKGFQEWTARAWAEIVSHPDEDEYAKHLKAGTRTEKLHEQDFRYAVQYMQKAEQKRVPEGFRNVGRFWGVWNEEKVASIVVPATVDLVTLASFVEKLADIAETHSPRFAQKLRNRFATSLRYRYPIAFEVWGTEAVQWALGASLPPHRSRLAQAPP